MTAPARTVKVRLLVAVWPDGAWAAPQSWSGYDDAGMIDDASTQAGTDIASASLVWAEIDIPIPSEPAVVVGRVAGEG